MGIHSPFSTSAHFRAEVVDVTTLMNEALSRAKGELGSVLVSTNYGEHLPAVNANPADLTAVFHALVVSAARAMAPAPEAQRRMRIIIRSKGEHRLQVSVSDRGAGEEPSDVPSFCEAIVKDLEGELTFDSRWGEGTTASVVLPAEPRE